ncbi:MAG: hypothetical protein ACRDMA_12875 [Solirubrobacterales bacterium]
MRRFRQARPSPALVVAIMALVAALAGTAIAADPAANTAISKKKTKKIVKKQINKLAPGLSVNNADNLGEVAAEEYQQRLYAVVDQDGNLSRGANAESAEKAAAFVYDVGFDRDVTECAYGATVGRPDDIVSLIGFATVNRDPTNPNGVRVFTYNAAGAGAARPFHLQVSC